MEIFELALKYIMVFIFGLTIGSFINCLIWRYSNNVKITTGRSRCVHCGRQLRWFENIPLFSYLFLLGKCKTCKKPIPRHYLLVEFFCGVVFVLFFWTTIDILGDGWLHLWRILFMLSILVIIFATDVLYQIIWPEIVWLGAILGFIFNFLIGKDILQMTIGFAVGGGFFLLQYLVSGGKWIGGGDVRLGAMMGVWLGWPVVLIAIFLAYITGAIFGLSLLALKKKTLSAQMAFGPFLALATLFCLQHGEQVINWYRALIF